MRYELRGDAIAARYLGPGDEQWLASLLDLVRCHEGLPRRQLHAALRDEPTDAASLDAVRLAAHVTLHACAEAFRAPVDPRLARWELFAERGRSGRPRDEVLAAVASRLAITPAELERSFHADRPSERIIGSLPAELTASGLVELCNLRLAQALVARASRLTIDLAGHVRGVAQHAAMQGLLCTVRGEDPARCRLEVSGPLAVLHPTRLYARAMASLVPLLTGCTRFRLETTCRLAGRELTFRLDEADPIGRGAEPRRHDSQVEAAFEADVRRLAPDWDVVREPQAVQVAGTLVFPDFAIGARAEASPRVLVEIMGWWRRDYVETKLERLRAARLPRLIVCLQERAGRGDTDTTGLEVVTFRRRVDVARVLERARALLERGAAAACPPVGARP